MPYFSNLADLPCTCPSQCCPWPLIWWMHCNSINWKRIKSWKLACPMVKSLLVTVLAEGTGSHPRGLGQPPCSACGQTNRDQHGWWHSSCHQSWDLLSTHMQGYLPLTSHQESSDVFCCCFWRSCSLLPWLFATFGRFDCPPAWEQKPGLLILGYWSSRGLSVASHWGLPSLAAAPQHSLSVCSSFLLSPESHRCWCLASAIAKHTQTLQNTLSKQWFYHKKPVNCPSRQRGEQHPSGKWGGVFVKAHLQDRKQR